MSEVILQAKQVHKTFIRKEGAPITVLSGVDFDVREGDRIAIIGKSGAGKSKASGRGYSPRK